MRRHQRREHAERLCDGLVIIEGGRTRFSGSVDEARAILPTQVVLVTERPLINPVALLPGTYVAEGANRYRFPLPSTGLEPLLARLIETKSGIRDMHIERPTLHDAFVAIVGEVAKLEGAEAAAA
jgi:ABC-2 type transport system ATP-binding protein